MSPIVFEALRIPLSSAKEGVTDYSFQAMSPEIEVGMGRHLGETIDVAARLTRMGEDFLLDLMASSEGVFVCDRCGDEFVRRIDGHVHTLWTSDRNKAGDEIDDDVRLLASSAEEIDLGGDVIDSLLLAIPAKILCSESCMGLCSQCGANLNEGPCSCQNEEGDPRWQQLKNLNFDE